MKNRVILVLACATLCLTGCFSIDTGRMVRTNEEHVLVSNYGWYLFHFIPLASGNAAKDRWLPWALFRNDVTMDKIQERFMDYAAGQQAYDLVYTTSESVMFELPGLNFPLPLPYLLTYREVQLSGVISPWTEAKDEGGSK